MKKIYLIFLFIFMNFNILAIANEKVISIKYKVNEDLITNYDIIKEAKYLLALNKKLENINNKQLIEIAKNSLLKEKIKKYEIEKFYEVNYKSSDVNIFIQNFMKELGFENLELFEEYLLEYETNIDEIRRKLVIEQLWNKMVFDLYKNRIFIDEKKISKKLEEQINIKKKQKSFELYEIIFSEKNKNDFDKKYSEILSSINTVGFEKTALIYSISNTAKQGGKIGWINQNQLSEKIINEVMNLDIGSYTKPINAGGASMILKVNDIKEVSLKDINKELEFEKIVTTEKNRQLNEFSVIHFKKTESKSYVKKF